MPTLPIGQISNQTASTFSSHLGTSRGMGHLGDIVRVQIDGFKGTEHLIAAKTSLSWFNRAANFVKCTVQSLTGRVDVYIDKDSMKKRMCDSVAGVLKIGDVLGTQEQDEVILELAKKLPEGQRQGTVAQLRERVLNDTTPHPEIGSPHGLLTLDINSIANMTNDQIVLLKTRICNLPDQDFMQLQGKITNLPPEQFMLFQDRIAELNDNDFMSFKDKIVGLEDDDFVSFSDRISDLDNVNFMHFRNKISQLPEDKFMLFSEKIKKLKIKDYNAFLFKINQLSEDGRKLMWENSSPARQVVKSSHSD